MKRKDRLKQGKAWARKYDGRGIISAYAKKFRVPKACAINDLTSFGVELDQFEVDRIRLNNHNNNIQRMPKKKLNEILDRHYPPTDEWDVF